VKFPHRLVDIPEELRSPASLWTHYICVRNSQWRRRPDTPLLAPEYFSLLDDASAECKQILSDEDKISTDFNWAYMIGVFDVSMQRHVFARTAWPRHTLPELKPDHFVLKTPYLTDEPYVGRNRSQVWFSWLTLIINVKSSIFPLILCWMYSWIYVMNILVPSLKLSRIAYFVLHRQRTSQSYILYIYIYIFIYNIYCLYVV
jgi:hypothetical protein